ncbi:hypothetical protein MYX07_04510 [Patescibacteria group bacterium AH-259-L07]|nr:hypothetical protein [Patescibacteria group bacterium AH-259-L07]
MLESIGYIVFTDFLITITIIGALLSMFISAIAYIPITIITYTYFRLGNKSVA